MSKSSASPVTAYLWMLCGSLAFTLMGTLTHKLRGHCEWQVIALTRAALAFLFAAMLTHAAGARFVFWRPRALWLRSTAGSVSMLCTFYSFTRLSVSEVMTLTNLFPVWVAILSWPMLGEVPSWGVWLSVGSGIAGVVLIQHPEFDERNRAVFVAVASSFATAIAMLGLHRLRDVDPRAIVTHFSGVAVIFCLAAVFLGRGLFGRDVPQGAASEGGGMAVSLVLLMLFGVGLSSTMGQLCLTKAFAAGAPAKVSVVGLSQVVFALAADVVLFGETVNLIKSLGMILIVAPTAYVMLRGLARPRAPATMKVEDPTMKAKG